MDDDSEFCSECGNSLNGNLNKNVSKSYFTINKKIVYVFIVILIIAIIGIFAYTSISQTNPLSEIVDSAKVDRVWVDNWHNDFWDDQDKILYVTFTPTRDIENLDGGEVSFDDELVVTYSDGSSEKIFSLVGEWCRDKILHSGESYTSGIAFESNGKTPTHVSGKLILLQSNGKNVTDSQKEVIVHFDSDV